jgi:hypothetical protein
MEPFYIGANAKSATFANNPDTKFCNLICMTLFMIFTLVVVFGRRDVNENYWI